LKGTLGAILVERGNFAEAKPLLQECLEQSLAHHDQGISAFYLGLVKLHDGRIQEAKRLIKYGMVLHPEPWLLAKAKASLQIMANNSDKADSQTQSTGGSRN
jgi:hypothetical protein